MPYEILIRNNIAAHVIDKPGDNARAVTEKDWPEFSKIISAELFGRVTELEAERDAALVACAELTDFLKSHNIVPVSEKRKALLKEISAAQQAIATKQAALDALPS